MKNKIFTITLILIVIFSCCHVIPLTITDKESALINESPDVMRILSIDNDTDLAILQAGSSNFNVRDLNTQEYWTLVQKMVKTLKSGNCGVSLAAPQVGINRRVVAITRIDKEGKPIEVYPNLRIEEVRGENEVSDENTISKSNYPDTIMRYRDITIVYTDINSDRIDQPREIHEDVTGFAAIIFQHEVNKLDGIVFTDNLR